LTTILPDDINAALTAPDQTTGGTSAKMSTGGGPKISTWAQDSTGINSQLRLALEASSAGFALFDAEGYLTYINDAYREIACGIADVLVPGMIYDDIVRISVERGTIKQAIGREEQWLEACRASHARAQSVELYRLDSQRWILRQPGNLPDGGSFHVLTDITAQKDAAQALLESESRLTDLAEQATSWVWEVDSSERFVALSGDMENICGIPLHAVLGRTRAEVYEAYMERSDTLTEHFYRRRRTENWADLEVVFKRPDGQRRHLLISGRPVYDDHARLVGYRGTSRDITSLHKAQRDRTHLFEQLRLVQRFEAVGQVTAGIAHDFNNLLTAILGFADLSLYRAKAHLPVSHRNHLKQIEQAAERGQALVSKLVTYHRGISVSSSPQDPLPLMRSAIDFARATLPTSITMHEHLTAELLTVALDAVHVEQVVLNLCINSRDAMKGVGEVTVSFDKVQMSGQPCGSCGESVDGQFARINVTDDGPGITSATVVDRMFEPFFTTKGKDCGSGMGLPVVHGIAHELGGHVCVAFPEQGGFSVSVLIPLKR
jgi:PAS domain S-box-containing protein